MAEKHTTSSTVIYLGTDHAGLALKNAVKDHLVAKGYHVHDLGAMDDKSSDYPDFILPAAEATAQTRGSRGIVFGGSGIGECIAANKVRGVRCALVYDAFTAKMSREHNDANMMSLGARTPSGKTKTALRLVDLWLKTKFSGDERHVRRLKKISSFEKGSKARKPRKA